MMDVIVIGAGISGLTAAQRLRQRGWKVAVLEKARGVGGRMATRRETANNRRWDHGAQFFTMRSTDLKHDLRDLLSEGVLREWGPDQKQGADARWIHPLGMSALAKTWGAPGGAPGELELSCRVTRVTPLPTGWSVYSEEGREWHSRALVVTAPLPQALDLFKASALNVGSHPALRALRYHSCFTLLVSFQKDPGLPDPGWIEHPHPDLRGIFDQNRKGLQSNGSAVVIHTTPEASARWLATDEETVIAEIWNRARPFLAAEPSEMKLHRWRYSDPAKTFPSTYFETIESGSPLFLAGDAFGGPRVEGAYLSGVAVVARVDEHLRNHPQS